MGATDDASAGTVTRADDLSEFALLYGRGRAWTLASPATGARHVNFHLSSLRPGSGQGPYHIHKKSESAYYVLGGTGEFTLSGVTHAISEGCAVYVPPGVRHSVTNVGDTELRMIGVYAPPEPDYTELADPGDAGAPDTDLGVPDGS